MAEEKQIIRPRPFWSGVVAFGLVSLPVSLFPANRGKSFHLKMVDEDGNQLRRQFFCEAEQIPLDREDIVRGYAIAPDEYVVVEDEELEELAPEKTREIDLKRFVPLDGIDPIFFERAYFLVPDGGANKAYRLLARSMEDEQRAGIATFVMRGKEYLVAIIAEDGILRAETLRFHDEVRSPEMIGLPEKQEAAKAEVTRMRKAMRSQQAAKLDRDVLIDEQTQKLMALVKKKLKAGKDVVEAPQEVAEDSEDEDATVIDLMQVLKERLQGREADAGSKKRGKSGNGKSGNGKGLRAKLKERSKAELYEEAQKRDIAGRSNMNRDELIEALSAQRQ